MTEQEKEIKKLEMIQVIAEERSSNTDLEALLESFQLTEEKCLVDANLSYEEVLNIYNEEILEQ